MRNTYCLERIERRTSEDTQRRGSRGALTFWKWQRDGHVMVRKITDSPSCTHFLQIKDGGTCQNTEKNRACSAHSLAGNGRGRDLSKHGKKPTQQRALTSWRRQREGLVMTRKEAGRAKHTHSLEMAEEGTCQDKEKKKQGERGTLTS